MENMDADVWVKGFDSHDPSTIRDAGSKLQINLSIALLAMESMIQEWCIRVRTTMATQNFSN